MEPNQLAAVLLILGHMSNPPYQEVCVAAEDGTTCAEFQSWEDPVLTNPFENVYYLSTPDQLWALNCGDDLIKYGEGTCSIGDYTISIAFDGYGFRIQQGE